MNRDSLIAIIWGLLGIGVTAVGYYFASKDFTFNNPMYLWGLLILPLMVVYEWWSSDKRQPTVQLSTAVQFGNSGFQIWPWIISLPVLLRISAVGLFIIALARPQSQLSWKDVETEGIDIIISMDISASMLAKDFDPNRLESSKEVAIDFIDSRPNDRIGLVVYEGESFTQCPLTSDHKVLKSLFKEVRTGMVEGGTAIGMGLATSVSRLKDSEAKSKVVILLTDGENNRGSIAPVTAAEIAQNFDIRVYTIGVGSRGKALAPTQIYPNGKYRYDYVDVNINEEALQEIADMTGGKYFRATNGDALEAIYQEIDRLEKTKISVTEHSQKSEEFFWFAAIGGLILSCEFLLRTLVFQTLP